MFSIGILLSKWSGIKNLIANKNYKVQEMDQTFQILKKDTNLIRTETFVRMMLGNFWNILFKKMDYRETFKH